MAVKPTLHVIAAAIIFLSILALCVVMVHAAFAHEDGTDPNAGWFKSLRGPTGILCCDLRRDCTSTDKWTVQNNHYIVQVGNEWIDVPDENILRNVPNPTGMAVECHAKTVGLGQITYIRCFVLPDLV